MLFDRLMSAGLNALSTTHPARKQVLADQPARSEEANMTAAALRLHAPKPLPDPA
ncbi:hypothetical protein [Streptomyces sp. NPDC045714]|uniref:hypothetical protein n=1 Tax=Streptomyces sp. NPDC045714 TaxID=3154913 RepID=UPI0033D24BAA